MYKEVLTAGDFTSWALTSLVIFLIVFTSVLIWIFRKGSKEQYDALAQMPLEPNATTFTTPSSVKE